MMNFDLTSATSSISALQALAGDSAEAKQNITALSEMVADADYTIKQLTRALREETEPPTFMGEPVSNPRTRAIGSWLKAQSNLSQHWKTNGPTAEPQWCGDANKLLEMARELFLQEPGWCDVCDRNRAEPCDFPLCDHGSTVASGVPSVSPDADPQRNEGGQRG